MKQTAVEWLVEQIKSKADSLPTNTKENIMAKGIYVDCLTIARQAKGIEKQQMRDCFLAGDDAIFHGVSKNEIQSFEQYYNETFLNNK